MYLPKLVLLYVTCHGEPLDLEPDPHQNFAREIAAIRNVGTIDHVILNPGILEYPNVGPAS